METKEKWIFQDIEDLKEKYLYDERLAETPYCDRIAKYNAALRENIEPQLYVRYILWQHDIIVDLEMIEIVANNVYPQLTRQQIDEWVFKFRDAKHLIV